MTHKPTLEEWKRGYEYCHERERILDAALRKHASAVNSAGQDLTQVLYLLDNGYINDARRIVKSHFFDGGGGP